MQKMIRILCLVSGACLWLLAELPAQSYLPMVKENAEWTVLKINGRTQPDPNLSISYDSSYVRTWIAGDTVIAGTPFKKVFYREFAPGANIPVYQGAIREAEQMVTWIPAAGENVGRLDTLYNFNVEVGDTVARYRHMVSFYDYVGKVDSITLQDGIKRKRIYIYTGPYNQERPTNTWIEGVGEMRFGLIYPFCSQHNPRCADQFLCYKESENLVYESFPSACNLHEGKPNTFLPLPTKDVEWSVLTRFSDNFLGSIYTTHHYRLLGDTILQDKIFTKLYRSAGKAFNIDSAEYVGAYINESSYVFFIDKGRHSARLLYNFNAPIGWISTTLNCNPNGDRCTYYQLVSKDTIMYKDQIKRMRYNFELKIKRDGVLVTNDRYSYSWIEGLGSTLGILPDPYIYSFSPIGYPFIIKDLLCFKQNDTLMYTHPDLYKGNCYMDLVDDVKDLDSSPVVNIYPNPAFEKLFIQSDLTVSKNTSSIVLIDVMGRVVLQKPLDAALVQLDVSNLSPGIYFVQILSKEGRVRVSKKIVKSN